MDHELAHTALEVLLGIVNLATLVFARRAHIEARQTNRTLRPPPLPSTRPNE